ncbi:MAG: helix-turn-helix transcriptional regulator, partial [Lachnospiraceae bacterium]|nr:helix-turn-helix transcriptional regulator [Lachnospiraceae bacterium]
MAGSICRTIIGILSRKKIDWIDEHAMENPGLIEMSKQIGYSPYYCSEQFHRVAGITIKDYMARR